MRSWSFVFENSDDAAKAFVALQDMFKDCEDFKKKKIFYCAMKDKDDDMYKIFLGIEDNVAGVFNVITMNAFEENRKNMFTVTKSDCKDINIELPKNCKIASWWEPDRLREKDKETNKGEN